MSSNLYWSKQLGGSSRSSSRSSRNERSIESWNDSYASSWNLSDSNSSRSSHRAASSRSRSGLGPMWQTSSTSYSDYHSARNGDSDDLEAIDRELADALVDLINIASESKDELVSETTEIGYSIYRATSSKAIVKNQLQHLRHKLKDEFAKGILPEHLAKSQFIFNGDSGKQVISAIALLSTSSAFTFAENESDFISYRGYLFDLLRTGVKVDYDKDVKPIVEKYNKKAADRFKEIFTNLLQLLNVSDATASSAVCDANEGEGLDGGVSWLADPNNIDKLYDFDSEAPQAPSQQYRC